MSHGPKCRTTGKVIYRESTEATCAAEYIMAIDYRADFRLFVYKCPHCKHYHLTKKPKQDGQQPQRVNG